MVNVQLLPHRGNASRAFPHTGILGLTPVTVSGIVRVQIDEDRKPLADAFSLVVRVRCYAGEGGAASNSARLRLLYEVAEALWTPPAGQDTGVLGAFEAPFRLVVPKDATSEGAVSMMSFKSFRTFWTVDGGTSLISPL